MNDNKNVVRRSTINRRDFLNLSAIALLTPFLPDGEIFIPLVANGNAGSGSLADPWALETALTNSDGQILPGHEIVLRGGNYFGDYLCNLAGKKDCPIRIRNYEGEAPVIFGEIVYAPESQFVEWDGVVFL